MIVIYHGDPVVTGNVLYEGGKIYDWPQGRPLIPGMQPASRAEAAKYQADLALSRGESVDKPAVLIEQSSNLKSAEPEKKTAEKGG